MGRAIKSPPMKAVKCASIGYQGRRIDEFCEALAAAGVPMLVDVRDRAWSHRPEFRKEALRTALEERGIEYCHLKVAGNPTRPKKGEPATPGACEAAYVAYLADRPEVVDQVRDVLATNPGAALFCYESHRSACHRGVLIKSLGAATVQDL